MLVLSRRIGEKITIGDSIVFTIIDIVDGNKIRVGIEAPRDVTILRNELIGKEKRIKGVGDEPTTVSE